LIKKLKNGLKNVSSLAHFYFREVVKKTVISDKEIGKPTKVLLFSYLHAQICIIGL